MKRGCPFTMLALVIGSLLVGVIHANVVLSQVVTPKDLEEQAFQGKMPTWNDFVAHPNYDDFWKTQASAPYLKRVSVPTLHVAGWFDQEDFFGPLKTYELLEPHDKNDQNFLVVGPWNHGGWQAGPCGRDCEGWRWSSQERRR